jgi:hypothetical protein
MGVAQAAQVLRERLSRRTEMKLKETAMPRSYSATTAGPENRH